MNRINFNQTGGFPLETNTLQFLQNAYQLFGAFSALAGDLVILQGCTVTGSSVSDGVVIIGGEVLPFKKGVVSPMVVVKEVVNERQFEDGTSKQVYFTRYATFGIGGSSYRWADFKRVDNLQQLKETTLSLQKKVCPVGLISMWSGSVIPGGWVLCDGRNDTPDLRNRFIVGAGDNYNIGVTGGEDKHALTVEEMPRHKHSSDGIYKYFAAKASSIFKTSVADLDNNTTNDTELALAKINFDEAEERVKGGGTEHENRPPFYALAYIMFEG